MAPGLYPVLPHAMTASLWRVWWLHFDLSGDNHKCVWREGGGAFRKPLLLIPLTFQQLSELLGTSSTEGRNPNPKAKFQAESGFGNSWFFKPDDWAAISQRSLIFALKIYHVQVFLALFLCLFALKCPGFVNEFS